MEMEHSGHMTSTGARMADMPASHGMAVLGIDTIFLSHLPMPHSPHDYQVLLEASFGPAGSVYRDDRKANPGTGLYTFNPRKFVLPEILPGKAGEPPRLKSFTGSVSRNHFEEPPAHAEAAVRIASSVVVEVVNVVYHHKFDPQARPLEHLTYILFGKGPERFLAHQIIGPFGHPHHEEFDHLVSVGIQGHDFSDDQLRHGVVVTLTGRPNEPNNKVQEREKVAAFAHLDGQEIPVEVDVRAELYFETSDLK